jgi:hypothetical protein
MAPLVGFMALLLFWGPTEERMKAPASVPVEDRHRRAASDVRITTGEEAMVDVIEAWG